MFKKYLIIFYLFLCSEIISQSLFPLHINDQWTYRLEFRGQTPSYSSYKIISEQILENGKKYFRFDRFLFGLGNLVRADSQYVYCYFNVSTPNGHFGVDIPIFNLIGKTGYVEWPNYRYHKIITSKIDTTTIFDEKVKSVSYYLETISTKEGATIAEKYGIISYKEYPEPPEAPWSTTTIYTLVGCKINNIDYGIILKVDQSQDIPKEYLLLQNYPNPFNPITTISYQIPKQSKVVIMVLDVLGREIETLVNEERPAGKYSVAFNGNNLASGVYFYQLLTNEIVITKKLVLMK